MKNHVFSKTEIATVLRDAYRTIEYCLSPKGRKINFFDGFTYVCSTDKKVKTDNEFDCTFTIFSLYLLMKKFVSNYEEGQYELINDNIDVDGIIYVEPRPNNLSAKKVITYFRNAFSHNDNPDHELYRFIMKENELFLEIHLKNVKGGPFHVFLDISTFYKIIRQIEENKLLIMTKLINVDFDTINSNNCIQELANAKIRTYTSKKDFSVEEKKEIHKLFFDDKKTISEINELYSEKFIIKDSGLELWQKIKFQEELKRFENNDPNREYDFDYIMTQIQPSAKFKSTNVDKLIDIISMAVLRENKSYLDTLKSLSMDNSYCDNTVGLHGLLDYASLIAIARSIYSGYMYDTLVLDEKIVIGDKEYDRERIRNSFTHMRWINRDTWYRLFDWYDNRKEEEKSDEDINVSFINLLNANDLYYYKSLKNEKNIFNTSDDDMIFFTHDDTLRVGIKKHNNFIYSDIDRSNLYEELKIFVMRDSGVRLANEDESLDYLLCMMRHRNEQKDELNKQIAHLIVDKTQKYILSFFESEFNAKSQNILDDNKIR